MDSLATAAITPARSSNYLTVEELADELRTSPETVHYWLKAKKAPPNFKVGRRRLFARTDVDAWIEASKRVPA